MRSATRLGAALLLLALAGPLRAQGRRPPAPPPTGPTSAPSSSSSPDSQSTRPGGTMPFGGEPAVPTEVGGKTLAQWKQDLTSGDAYVRAEAIGAVIHFGSASAEAVPLLLQRCSDRDVSPRTKAVIALRLARVADKDLPKVIDTLANHLYGGPYNERQDIVRYEAARSLLFYGRKSQAAVAALAKGAEDPDCVETRHVCLIALRVAGSDEAKGPDPRATSAMLKALGDPTGRIRLEAIMSLGGMGRPRDPALLAKVINALKQVLYSRHRAQVMWAHVGLLAMDDKLVDSSLKALARYLKSTDMKVRVEAAHVFAALGPRAKPVVPALLEHLSDKEPVVVAVLGALGRIGDSSPRVLDAMVQQLNRTEPVVLAATCFALADLGVSTPATLDALRAAAARPKIDKDLKAVLEATLDHFTKPKK